MSEAGPSTSRSVSPYAMVIVPVALMTLAIASLDSYAHRKLWLAAAACGAFVVSALGWSTIREVRGGRLSVLRALGWFLFSGPLLFAGSWVAAWIFIGGLVHFTSYEKEQIETTVERVFKVRGRTCVEFYYDRIERLISPCGKLYFAETPKERDRLLVHSKVGPLGVTVLRLELER